MLVDRTVTEDGIHIYDDENGFRVHYETTDVSRIVQSLASQWPRICQLATEEISRLHVAPPQRIVVLVRPDGGLLFFTLESNGKFVHDVASVTVQFIEDAFLQCEDDFDPVYRQLREIAHRSFAHPSVAPQLVDFDLPIAIDDYQSVDPATFELLTE